MLMVGTVIDDLTKLQVRESCPCDRATERYRSAIGIHARRYERERLEAACERALAINATSYSSVNAILKIWARSHRICGWPPYRSAT